MKRIRAIVFCLLAVAAQASAEPPLHTTTADYVIVDFTGANDPYHKAAERLAELRHGIILAADPTHLEPLLDSLRKHPPRYVAFVVRPDQFDENLARSVLRMATEVDEDPFVDFAYGFITGDTPEAAVALVEKAQAAEKRQRKPELAVAAVGEKVISRSGVSSQKFALRKTTLPQLWGQIAGGENFPGEGRDAKFIKTLMPQLQGKSMIIFAGHGYPREVVGGPNYTDLEGINLDGSVVLNIACYTGVTGTWFEDDWQAGVVRRRTVPSSESFCLNMLKTGVAAYVAYSCARPAGPELFTDIGCLAGEGLSVGEVRRRDYNRVVLAHLAQDFDKLRMTEITDGKRLKPRQNMVKDLLLDMATGGVVFGDPALKPFPVKASEPVVEVSSQRKADQITITVQVAGQHLFYECGEQLDTWGDNQQPAMRLTARVPLGQAYVTHADVKELKVGGESPPHRIAWGIEADQGERFLHVKAIFPQPGQEKMMKLMLGAKAVFEATLTEDVTKAVPNSIVANKAQN